MTFILIGQKNVGKSSIFNKLIKNKNYIVHPNSGSTRDIIVENFIYKEKKITIIDTPGINPLSKKEFEINSLLMIKKLISKQHTILFVVDGQKNVQMIDKSILNWLRKFNLDIFLIINKIDNEKIEQEGFKFNEFGIKNYLYISCSHNYGINKIINILYQKNKLDKIDDLNNSNILTIGVYGKPNVGKSTFINNFIGYNRFQTGEKPGLTTDTVFHNIEFKNQIIKIFDTAGIRKQKKIITSLENIASNTSIKNISKTIISILMINSIEGLDRQDKNILKILSQKAKFIIIVFNKFDLIKDKKETKNNLIYKLNNEIYQINKIKYFFISSLNKNKVKNIFEYIIGNIDIDGKKIPTNKINNWLKETVKIFEHPLVKGKKINFKYALQINESPIIIRIYSNYSKNIKESYKRYLKNSFSNFFNIKNQNIKLIFSTTNNPYSK